jgi:acetyltransferase
MQTMIQYARGEGLQTIEGQVLNENATMLRMCMELGFVVAPDPDESNISVVRLALKRRSTPPPS